MVSVVNASLSSHSPRCSAQREPLVDFPAVQRYLLTLLPRADVQKRLPAVAAVEVKEE